MTNPTQKALDEALNEPDYALYQLRKLVDDYGHVFKEYNAVGLLRMAANTMADNMDE